MTVAPLPPRPLSFPDVPEPRLGDRSLFEGLAYRPFLAHAAISPLNLAGRRAVEHCMKSVTERGNGAFPLWMAQRERLRASLGRLLQVGPESIGLSPGCTRAITDVALALPWEPGYRLVTYRGEFPANVVPYQQAAQLRGGSVEFLSLPSSEDPDARQKILSGLKAVFENVSKKVAFLAVSAVQFQSGLRMPLGDIGLLCDRYGVSLLVDGIQGCGVMPIDLEELRIDAFFSGAHKWLLGLEGAGICAISPGFATRLKPLTAGWLSTEHAADFLFKGADLLRYDRPYLAAPLVFEGSTANTAGFAALEAGVDVIEHVGTQAIFDHVQNLFDSLEPRMIERGFRSLRAHDPELRSTILSFRPPSSVDLTRLFTALDQRGVRVSIPDGLLRIAPHFSNSAQEMDLFVAAVDESLAEIRG